MLLSSRALVLKARKPGDTSIMAHLNSRRLSPTLRTPEPSTRDSDDVLVALETARSLEVLGDLVGAARWLRRAADEAEKQGNDTRVLVFAHAAADLSGTSGNAAVTRAPVTNVAKAPVANVAKAAPRIVAQRPPQDSDPTLHWRAKPPPLPVRESSRPAAKPPISLIRERAVAAEPPATERAVRMGAIRVAVTKPANGSSFSVERLEADQPLPAGAVEGMLVLAGEFEEVGELDNETPINVVRRG